VKGKAQVWRDALRDSELPAMTKLIGHTLSSYLNGRGSAFPSMDTLAAGASVSDRTAHKAIAELEAAGFLIVERSRNRGGNRYQILLPETANELRHSEWGNGERRVRNGERHAQNGERRSGESVESAESGDALRSADASAAVAITETCLHCGIEFSTTVEEAEAFCSTDCTEAARRTEAA
jgi:hypothetical protein